jgi:hypothetical protein
VVGTALKSSFAIPSSGQAMDNSETPHDKPPYLKISNCPPAYDKPSDLPSYFGDFGGRFIPETLVLAHETLEREYVTACKDPAFREELEKLGMLVLHI